MSFPDTRRNELVVLGSTGSIGTQTLDVARLFPGRVRVRSLTAHSNAELLAEQALEFEPDRVVIGTESGYRFLSEALRGQRTDVLYGPEALREVAGDAEADVVIAAIVGFAGLAPVLEALEAGTRVGLANKETLVVAGALVRSVCEASGAELIPVDSEHSAIFQCLLGESGETVEELILTASGGPFRTLPAERFSAITPEAALDHPNWEMGAKITIDSATLMNKGLEVIEARWLFDIEPERLRVVVHPQSVVHSMVVFRDGAIKAELGPPDMKVPIQYALSYPDRWPAPHERMNWSELHRLDFEPPDEERFPCLALAFEALEEGGAAPAVLNAANEIAVGRFLQEGCAFTDIPTLIRRAMERYGGEAPQTLEEYEALDAEVRHTVRSWCEGREAPARSG